MEKNFEQCHREAISSLISEYLHSLSSPIDSYLEDHILSSQFYKLLLEDKQIGYFAIYKENLLTQFYVQLPFLKFSQPIFKELLNRFPIRSAYVPTCDELFLSLAIDTDSTFEKQAYFFQDSPAIDVSDKIYKQGTFRRATTSDIHPIVEISGDFFDKLEERIKNGEIFVFCDDQTLLGVGIFERGKLLKECASIGMFTNEKHRRKGIGRTIIIYLKRVCYERRLIPTAGCWYYNHNSKKTLESAGMITKTRLLKFKFESD